MSLVSIRNIQSSHGERVANRVGVLSSQSQRPLKNARSISQSHFNSPSKLQIGSTPGLYFATEQKRPTSTRQQERRQSGFVFSESNQKLYSPYEYIQYATKISGSKDTYLNSLEQLGYSQAQQFHSRPLNEIINNTSTIIRKSYSMKYMGIIDGNMGILSNRKRIQLPTPKTSEAAVITTGVIQDPSNTKADTEPQNKGYLIGQYSLPRGLKSVRINRDPGAIAQKIQLEKWHADQVKILQDQKQDKSQASLASNPSERHSRLSQRKSQLNINKGLPQQSKQSLSQSAIPQHFQQANLEKKELLKSSIYKKPLQNYIEDSEGICYAIIDTAPKSSNLSYSQLLGQIDKNNINEQQPHHLYIDKNKQQKVYQEKKQTGRFRAITYEQNQQLFQRFEVIEGRVKQGERVKTYSDYTGDLD